MKKINQLVTSAVVSTGTGDCSATTGQEISCTVDVPGSVQVSGGGSTVITVTYTAVGYVLDESIDSPYDTKNGTDFIFIFENGDVLEGSSNTGDVYYNGVLTTAGRLKNEYYFSEGDFTLHLSCSETFEGGWGDNGGPDEVDNTEWKIASFSIIRYKKGSLFKSCNGVVLPIEIDNTATAVGTDDVDGEVSVDSNTATVTLEATGFTASKPQTSSQSGSQTSSSKSKKAKKPRG